MTTLTSGAGGCAPDTRRILGRLAARNAAIALLAFALVLRLALVVATPGYELRSDPADYDRHGRSIADGTGYPSQGLAPGSRVTAYRPPVYPLFVGAVYAVAGPRPNAVRVAQAVVGTLVVGLIGWIAAALWGRWAALMAMGLAAVFPPLLLIGTALTPEVLFVALMLAALAATLRAREAQARRPLLWWALLAGALCGLAVLTRVNGAPLVPLLALAVWAGASRRGRRALGPALALVAAAVLVIAPWTVRNAVALDRFVPVSTQSGYTLAGTYNAGADSDRRYPAAWRPPVPEAQAILARKGPLDEAELGDELRAEAWRYVRSRPAYALEVAFWNSLRLAHLDGLGYAREDNFHLGVGHKLSDAGAVGLWLLLPLSLFGALLALRRHTPWLFWAVPAAMAPTIFVVAEIRFRAPIDPFLLMLAGLALGELVSRRAQRPRGPRHGS